MKDTIGFAKYTVNLFEELLYMFYLNNIFRTKFSQYINKSIVAKPRV